MNHFLLSNHRYARAMRFAETEAGRYGIHAMELLINEMLKMGASRLTMEAKVFGGGAVISGMNSINAGSRIVAMSFCEPRSWTRVLSS